MKMASALVDSDSEVGDGPEAVDTLRPRARPTVWPGRRPGPGIVAPRLRGSTWSRLSSTATSPVTGLRRIRDDVGRFRGDASAIRPGLVPPQQTPTNVSSPPPSGTGVWGP